MKAVPGQLAIRHEPTECRLLLGPKRQDVMQDLHPSHGVPAMGSQHSSSARASSYKRKKDDRMCWMNGSNEAIAQFPHVEVTGQDSITHVPRDRLNSNGASN